MFIRYFLEVPRAKTDVEAELLASPAEVLADPARDAQSRGDRLLAEIGFGTSPARLKTQVELQVGRPIRFPSKTVLPISWKPALLKALTPSLEADIEPWGFRPVRRQ